MTEESSNCSLQTAQLNFLVALEFRCVKNKMCDFGRLFVYTNAYIATEQRKMTPFFNALDHKKVRISDRLKRNELSKTHLNHTAEKEIVKRNSVKPKIRKTILLACKNVELQRCFGCFLLFFLVTPHSVYTVSISKGS